MNNLGKTIFKRTPYKGYYLIIDDSSPSWGKVLYSKEENEICFIASHPKYYEEGFVILAASKELNLDYPIYRD